MQQHSGIQLSTPPPLPTSKLSSNASESPESFFQGLQQLLHKPPPQKVQEECFCLPLFHSMLSKEVMGSYKNPARFPKKKHALKRGFAPDLIFMPEEAGEEIFLSNLRALQPGICLTAAYGSILPSSFFKIPPLGTVNLHPSLLPLYRGAAPFQKALQDGVKETGVSLVYTIQALDAGPVIAVRE